MMQIIVVGLDHHTSPVELREQVAFRPSQVADAFDQLLRTSDAPLNEAVILSTCNRVEVYGVAPNTEQGVQAIADFLHAFHGLEPGALSPVLYAYSGSEAVTHLFATACGLNSMIVGEPQIQAQVRTAAETAAAHRALGATLHALFRQAVAVGKRARTETSISRSAASVSHTGVELARRLRGELRALDILLVGTGKMSELAAKNLIDNGARSITLVNRTVENAQVLAARWGAKVLPFDALAEALGDADVVISSTAAPHPIIGAGLVRQVMQERTDRPLLLIDLAVPRDVETEVAKIAGVHVYDIDDLQQVVSTNIERRRDEIGAVRAIVEAETERFNGWLEARAVVPTLNRLRKQADSISRGELERAMRRLPELAPREREVMEALAAGIVNKLLHQPTVRLKQEAGQGNGAGYAAAIDYLFGLETP